MADADCSVGDQNMAGTLITCPNCRSTLTFGQSVPANATLRCPLCTTTFTAPQATAAAPAKAAPAKAAATPAAPPSAQAPIAKAAAAGRPASAAPAVRPAAPAAAARSNGKTAPRPAAAVPARQVGSRRLLAGVIVAAVGFLILAGGALLLWSQMRGDRPTNGKDAGVPGPVAINGPVAGPTAPVPDDNPSKSVQPAPPTTTPPGPPKDEKAKPKQSGGLDIADLPTSKTPETPAPLPEPSKKSAPPEAAGKPDPSSKPDPAGKPEPKGPTVPIVIPGTPAAAGVDTARVDAAIAHGVDFLKGKQVGDGAWRGGPALGYAGLCGLALLECQVPANDPAITKAAEYVRNHVGDNRQVYEQAASILFLERLGAKGDRDLIRYLAIRLLASQNPAGGWGYTGQPVYAVDPSKLQDYLRTHFPWDAKHPRPASGGKAAKAAKDAKGSGPTVDLQKLPAKELLWNKWNPFMLNPGDNSNTQFALLALWAARRHDVPVECAALLSYERYRRTQNQDGGWGYAGPVTLKDFPPHRPIPPGTPIPGGAIPPGFFPPGGMPALQMPQVPGGLGNPMNPMGVRPPAMPPGLAPPGIAPPGIKPPGIGQPGVGQPGVAPPPPPLGVGQPGVGQPGVAQPPLPPAGIAPPPMNAGGGMGGGWGTNIHTTPTMTCVGLLGLAMGHGAVPAGAKAGDDKFEDPAIKNALSLLARSVGNPVADPARISPQPTNLYLLWSIERVAMLYDLKTIGGKDWYGWGAQILLNSQNGDGSWGQGGYTGATAISDTCFALLFLKRSNLMPDLTENLRLQMVIRDPVPR